tara:strand:- start:79 stop:396 length:318 start_codon:yes stop_codon:yes gene_type:complete
MFFALNGARFRFLSTVPAIVSYQIAIWALTAAISAGFIATFDKFPQVFVALKVSGSLYALWIAWRLFKLGMLEGYEITKSATFKDGVTLLILNPVLSPRSCTHRF